MSFIRFNVVGDFNVQRKSKIGYERTINMYVTPSTEESKNALVPLPGISSLVSLKGYNPTRSLFVFKDKMLCINDDNVYLFYSSNQYETLGKITTARGYARMAANQTQVLIIDGIHGYIYNSVDGSFTRITNPQFPVRPNNIACLDGFFVVSSADTNEFQISAVNDGTSWNALNYARFTTKAGNITGIISFHRKLFIFTEDATEVWYNAGASDIPFRRDNSLIIEYGCIAPESISHGEDLLIWLAKNDSGKPVVMLSEGGSPTKVSSPAVEYALQEYTKLSDASGFIYKEDGHTFYELSFTKDNKTWVYDATMNLWFEREYQEGRYLAQNHAYFDNKHIVGSYASAKLYELSSKYITDDGEAVLRRRVTSHLHDPTMRDIYISKLQFDLLQGTGTEEEINYDPKIYLKSSKDGGSTWGFINEIPVGKIGKTRQISRTRNMGKSKDWLFDIRYYAGTHFVLFGLVLDVEYGSVG